jgi:LemA protein
MPYIIASAAAAAVILGVIIWAVSTSNKFKAMLVKIREADSGIDVALTKRFDTLTKLLDVVRAYAKHEAGLIAETIKLRSGMGLAERAEAHRQMDAAERQLNVVAEAYPELRSNENFKQLQTAIVEAEDHLQGARRVYNMNVSVFNQSIVQFPASIIANGAKYTPQPFFEAEQSKREDVKINL